ncbi:hypothetical protein RHMOL_Rhmol04G0378500 [Rhododendron molle]|uniref:Uncharacterized protein n=1 Tax=Rhododendron molle TaxID=49168 RepID=A0ACC0P9T1_RHOML|nr:hypothetical protein RHMOL_Rhmol04G0378500 [Rhododendron molle]
MAQFPLIFILLVSLMLSLSCAKNDSVDLICERTKYAQLCEDILYGDNRTLSRQGVRPITYATIGLALTNAKTTVDLLNTLVGRAQDPGIRKNLIFCRYQYDSVAINALSKAFVDLYTSDFKKLYKVGMELEEAGIVCESTLLGVGTSYSANLTSSNQKTKLFGEIISVVATLNNCCL